MKYFIAMAFIVGSFTACQKSPEQKAEELSETQKNAVTKADEARREADRKSAKAYDEADRTIQEQQQKVDDKANEVVRNADSVRADARRKIEGDLSKVDKRLADLRTKVATVKTTKAPRVELEESLRTLQAQSDSLRQSIPELQSASPVTLSSVRTKFESRISEIERSLDDLERKV